MNPIKLALGTAIAAAGLVLMALPALAATAYATAPVNVRSGPGTGYGVVDSLQRGEEVDVRGCRSGWCRIEHPGPDGWVSASYLSGTGGSTRSEPSINLELDLGGDQPRFGISIGEGNSGVTISSGDRACFYEDYNYRGDSFCLRRGDADERLSGYWNNRISSVRLYGDGEITLCTSRSFRGDCRILRGSDRRLNFFFDDDISSVAFD